MANRPTFLPNFDERVHRVLAGSLPQFASEAELRRFNRRVAEVRKLNAQYLADKRKGINRPDLYARVSDLLDEIERDT